MKVTEIRRDLEIHPLGMMTWIAFPWDKRRYRLWLCFCSISSVNTMLEIALL
jgi:hypothetical protein